MFRDVPICPCEEPSPVFASIPGENGPKNEGLFIDTANGASLNVLCPPPGLR